MSVNNPESSSTLTQHGNHKRARITIILAAIVVVVLAIAGTVVGIQVAQHQTESPTIQSASTDGATVRKNGSQLFAPDLPFSLDGVPVTGSTVEVSEGAQPAQFQNSWIFGGDFSQIGSFPIDADTVFGSSTTDSNNLQAYYAALIGQNGNTQNIDPNTQSSTFYEPQDGTGDGNRIVWRSSTLNTAAQTSVDNWRLQTWDKASDKTVTLGTAAALNGRDDTPATYGEVVPTFNEKNAYFAANIRNDDTWQETILQYSLTGDSEKPRVIAAGNFPAATKDGVLFASDPAQKNDFRAYAALKHDDGTKTTTVFTVHSDNNAWGIAGVWAHGDYRAVAFSDGTQTSGNYIGLWSDDFKTNLGWIHVKSASVVASMNSDWIVWGSGSQTDNVGMYAFNWQRSEVKYLGGVQGYSRPTIAADSNTVMIPQYDGTTQAVAFTVGSLD
ncbi:hypothetical protein [Bifidobacterium sp. SO4]|uniref:hypothetical protein n=1 Tax=Bifidobacterium sp. SO4 TaxID=2809030 RepID=UPI001BDC351E|nr:hypothetical protein [Bifidobacterium sp. SO4]MBT1171514.1 hypothetical protein [Bifidobacterium sp. SO4]